MGCEQTDAHARARRDRRRLAVLARACLLVFLSGASACDPGTEESDSLRPISCVDSLARRLVLVRATTLQAEGGSVTAFVGPPRRVSTKRPWTPGRISDVVPTTDGYLVVDALAGELIRLSRSLDRWRVIAAQGEGPGELSTPVTAAVDPVDGGVFVLDVGPRIVHHFAADGTYSDRFHLRTNARDLSVATRSRVWLVHHVQAMRLSSVPGTVQPIAISYTSDGEDERTHWEATADSLGSDRYNLSGEIPAEISATGRFVAIYFATSGVVELFEDGHHLRSMRVCVPQSVADFYDAQSAEGYELGGPEGRRPTVRERYFPLIADVRVDKEGAVAVLSGAPTETGALHVDHFDRQGRQRGSVLLDGGRSSGRYPSALRLDTVGDSVIVGFDLVEGHVVKYEFSAAAGEGDR